MFCTRAVQSNRWHNFIYIVILVIRFNDPLVWYISSHILINLIDMKLVPRDEDKGTSRGYAAPMLMIFQGILPM
jgi:hypothetical protein